MESKSAFSAVRLKSNLRFLLRKISLIEKIDVDDIVSMISSEKSDKIPLSEAIAVFCANYFSQASTLLGHDLAGHGQGNCSITNVFKCVGTNNRNFEYSFILTNEIKLIEDRVPFKQYSCDAVS